MNNGVEWGIPTQRTRKTERFDFPVMTMVAIDDTKTGKGSGSNRKITFNRVAVDTMGLNGQASAVSFGFGKNAAKQYDGTVYLRVSEPTQEGVYALNKSNAFSNKKIFTSISKIAKLDNSVENNFRIVSVEDGAYSLELISSSEETSETPITTQTSLTETTGSDGEAVDHTEDTDGTNSAVPNVEVSENQTNAPETPSSKTTEESEW